jgi:uncharacterized membrane protein
MGAGSEMEAKLARRARLQLIFMIISLVLTVLAAVLPVWIEGFTSLEPDGGSGALEWLLAVVFGAVSIVFGVLTYRTRRQLATVTARG